MKPIGKDIKFVLIGGGSFGWTHRLITDICCIPELHGLHVVLEDINLEAVKITSALCRKVSNIMGAGLKIECSGDLDSSLKGADFIGMTISTGGDAANKLDHSIPEKYGIYQTVGDTVGPGGWARALRNIPVVVDIARKAQELAPNAWFMNYSNPMTTLTRAMLRTSDVKTIGLCHELQGLLLHLACWFGVDWQKDIKVRMAGINHLIWILDMDVRGRDGISLLKDYFANPAGFTKPGKLPIAEELIAGGGIDPNQKVKADLLARTGFLSAAGDSHIAEFFKDYICDIDTMTKWGLEADRKSHTFAHVSGYENRKQSALYLLDGKSELYLKHSHEHASRIIAALSGISEPLVTPVNMANVGQVDNLPRKVVLETMAMVDGNGVQPIAVGELPPLLVSYLMAHIPVQEMIVEAGLSGDRELAVLALAQDPLVPSTDLAEKIADDFFDTFRELMPQFNGKWSL